jgi:DNA polymerase elongation subunit (family B)
MKKVFLLIVTLLSLNGFSCTCIQKPPIKKAYEDAGEIIIGKVIRVDSTHFNYWGSRIYIYDIETLNSYKSKFEEKNTIVSFISTNDGAACDYTFLVGKTYLIYTANNFFNSSKYLYETSICSRTALLSKVDKREIEMLEKLQKDFKDTDSATITMFEKDYKVLHEEAQHARQLTQQNQYLMIICGILFITALIFIFLYIKTKKKLQKANKF